MEDVLQQTLDEETPYVQATLKVMRATNPKAAYELPPGTRAPETTPSVTDRVIVNGKEVSCLYDTGNASGAIVSSRLIAP